MNNNSNINTSSEININYFIQVFGYPNKITNKNVSTIFRAVKQIQEVQEIQEKTLRENLINNRHIILNTLETNIKIICKDTSGIFAFFRYLFRPDARNLQLVLLRELIDLKLFIEAMKA